VVVQPTRVPILLLLHLPSPVGWIALTPDALRAAQAAASEVLGSDINTDTDTASPAAPTGLVSAADAGRLLGVDPSHLLRLAREGRIDFVKVGRYVRFRPTTIIEQGTRCARSPAAPPAPVRRTTPGGSAA
jgi:excisionase family DNA binding protein